jgi:thiamine pyrophosphokinase
MISYLLWPIQFPEAVVGDLDSLKDDVRDFLESAGGTEIVRDPDQESTDFTKALRWFRKQGPRKGRDGKLGDHFDVVAFGGLGGRMDQGFSMIHHLFKAASDPELLSGDIYMLSEQSLSFVLKKGQNTIHGLLPGTGQNFAENVGIIPIRGPAIISTKGLEWDVEDWKTEFGGKISTSNHIRADVVRIRVSDPVLFTIELAVTLSAQ